MTTKLYFFLGVKGDDVHALRTYLYNVALVINKFRNRNNLIVSKKTKQKKKYRR